MNAPNSEGVAHQRYYAYQAGAPTGRFRSPDPGGLGTADPSDPQSWNRYAYVGGDPINFNDPTGRSRLSVAGTGGLFIGESLICSVLYGVEGVGGGPFGGPVDANSGSPGGGGGGIPADLKLNKQAQGLLDSRLANFGTSHCNEVFSSVIDGYHTTDIQNAADSKNGYNVNFYNPTSDGGYTQGQVTGNGSDTKLSGSVTTSDVSVTVNGNVASAIVLNGDFFLNSNATFQENVLLHELLHAYTKWTDTEMFSNFSQYGLTHASGVQNNTEDISAWLSTDCKSTPTSLTWWN